MAYDKHGWSTDARGGLNMPPAIGKLMGLTEEQIAHATAICAGRGVPLGILDADKEENSMAKNLRFGQITRDAIVACMLAKEGLTGPLRVVEGDGGYRDGILRGDLDLAALTNFDGWKIRDTRYKRLCANGSTQGYLHATHQPRDRERPQAIRHRIGEDRRQRTRGPPHHRHRQKISAQRRDRRP